MDGFDTFRNVLQIARALPRLPEVTKALYLDYGRSISRSPWALSLNTC